MKRTTAADRFALKDISGELSDARFRPSDISFDQNGRSWTLVCWGPRRRHGAVRTEWWEQLKITVSDVVGYEPLFTEDVDYYEVASVLLSEDKLQLRVACHYGAEFRLSIAELHVELFEGGATKPNWG